MPTLLATLCINTRPESHHIFQEPFSESISQGLKPSRAMFSVPQHMVILHRVQPSLSPLIFLTHCYLCAACKLRAMIVCFLSSMKVLKTWAVNSFTKNPSRNSTASWQSPEYKHICIFKITFCNITLCNTLSICSTLHQPNVSPHQNHNLARCCLVLTPLFSFSTLLIEAAISCAIGLSGLSIRPMNLQ